MKGKKYGIIVSVITMIITFILILMINWCNKDKYELLSNILIGILGSSVVTLIISISDYVVAKRVALEDYYNEVYKVMAAFSKIQYTHISERVIVSAKFRAEVELQKIFGKESFDMDEIMDYYNKHHYFDVYLDELTDDEKNQIILEQVNDDVVKIIKAMNSYLQFDDVSYEGVENAYRRISFLIDKSKWSYGREKAYRIWLYQNFHERLRKMLNTIYLENNHFNLYKNQDENNILVIAEKIKDLNDKLFEIKREKGVVTVYFVFFDDMMDSLEEFKSRIYKCEKGTRMKVPVFTQY